MCHMLKRRILSKKNFFTDERLYENCTTERRRKNLQLLFNNTSIVPFKWRGKYLCFYCGLSHVEYTEFRKHTKSHGFCSTTDHALKLVKGNHIEVKIDVSEITCEICFESFESFEDIIDHLVRKHDLEYDKSIEIPFQEYTLKDCKCKICKEEFTYFGNLIMHTNVAHPNNSFICDHCGTIFNKIRDLAVHLRHFHREGGYQCEECSKVFSSYILLCRHKNNYHYRRCKICDSRFPSYTLLQKHIECDHPNIDIEKLCIYCSKRCQSNQGLKQHMSKCKMKACTSKPTKHGVNTTVSAFPEDNTIEPKKKRDITQMRKNIQCVLNMSTAIPFKFFARFSCFYCSVYFVDFDKLKEHVVAEHPVCEIKDKSLMKCKGDRVTVKVDISALSCKICYQPMENLDILIDHLVSKHNATYDTTITGCFDAFKILKDNIPCNVCSQVFRYFGTLLRHINSEHSTNKKICNFCGRTFKNAANLNIHMSYEHTGSCECDVCGTKFKNQWCLARHKAKSHDVKDFQCPKCPERFQSEYHKQKHLIKVHDIGHKCTYCGKMFTRNSFMKDHIRRTHLKEKNVPCSLCNEKFFDNYLLKLHMVKHKGERNFSCEVCGKAFLRRSNLNTHKQMHKKYGQVNSIT